LNGFTIGFDPVLFQFGALTIRWYGVLVALGFIVGLWLSLREAKRKGFVSDQILNLAIWILIGGLVGARLFFVVQSDWRYYLNHPFEIAASWQGGLAFYGAVIGGVLAGLIYTWRKNLPFLPLADAAVPGILLGQAVGRVGCLINGCCAGTQANLPWSITYTHPNALVSQLGVEVHPTQLYEIVMNLVLFGFLWSIRKRVKIDGLLFLLYGGLYSVGRLFLFTFRDEPAVWAGLKQAQVTSLAIIVIALLAGWWLMFRQTKNPVPLEPAGGSGSTVCHPER